MSNRLRALRRRRVFAPLFCSGAAAMGGAAGASPATIEWRARYADTTNYAPGTRTQVATDIGAADANRVVVIAIETHSAGGTNAITGTVTIGGVNAALVVTGNAANTIKTWIYQASVPTGTTGDIVIPMDAVARSIIEVFRMVTTNTVATDTALNSSTSGANTVLGTSTTLDVPANGVGVVASVYGHATATAAWTPAEVVDGGSPTYLAVEATASGAAAKITTAGTFTPTITTSAGCVKDIVAAAWGP